MDNERNDVPQEIEYNPMPPVKKSKKPLAVPAWATIICVLIAVVVTFLTTFCLLNDRYETDLKKFKSQRSSVNSALGSLYSNIDEISNLIEKHYIYDVNYKEMTEDVLLDFMLNTGDRYGYYHTKEEWEEEENTSEGNSVGIGIRIVPVYTDESRLKINGLMIVHVMANTPASEAGFEDGDFIVEIDGKTLNGLTYSDALSLSLGEAGTKLEAKVERNGSLISISAIRGNYETETVTSKIIDGNVGYVKITEFYTITVDQFKKAVDKLIEDGCTSIVFDVRDNPGGELSAITKILDYILPEGPIVHIEEKNGAKITYKSGKECISDIKMAVLANGNTASAAELFTSALKDYEYAKIIGKQTYGKGCGQNLYKISTGGVVRITSFLYSPPFSENFDGVGIIPDIDVDLSDEFKGVNLYTLKYEDDAQLIAAVDYLTSK